MATIRARRRADGTTAYAVLFRLDGTQSSETFDDPATARRFADLVDRLGGAAARAMRDTRDGTGRPGPPTLAEWFDHHLEHATGITAGTAGEYRRLAARTWLPDLGAYPVDAITRDMVRAWIGRAARTPTRSGRPASAKTVANAHGLLSTVLAAAVEAGHRGDNPSRGLALPRGERQEMCFLSEAEFARLLACVPARDVPFVALLAGTGLRWGEATALQWGDLDLDAAVPSLRVARAWQRGPRGTRVLGAPKTSRSRRTVSLPGSLVDELRVRRVDDADALVFTALRGGPLHHQAWQPRVWLPAVAASGIGKRPRIHDLRHTHASWLIAAGVPLPVVQRRLGHESITTTVDTYGHLADGAAELAARAADLALTSALPELTAG